MKGMRQKKKRERNREKGRWSEEGGFPCGVHFVSTLHHLYISMLPYFGEVEKGPTPAVKQQLPTVEHQEAKIKQRTRNLLPSHLWSYVDVHYRLLAHLNWIVHQAVQHWQNSQVFLYHHVVFHHVPRTRA